MGKYTNIDDPSAYFQTAIWTGDGSHSSDRNITNTGNSDLQPDLIWGLCRSHVQHKSLTDSSRGFSTGNKEIISNFNNKEGDTNAVNSGGYGWLGPSLTDGFESSVGSVNNGYWNVSARTYAAWQWKANGGTTSSNTDGNITSTVQVNTTSGFSIVTYTGNGSDNQTIGHGLGVTPTWWVVKRRDSTSSWNMGCSLGFWGGTSNYMLLNATNANEQVTNIWGDSPPNSTTIRVKNDAELNASGGTYVAYVFANKQGFQKSGSYKGNGNANGTFVYTGFKPAWVMVKRNDAANSWLVMDNQRGINGATPRAYIHETDADGSAGDYIDFLGNGFKIRTSAASMNANNGVYFYVAFAENPLVTSTGIMGTAR